MTCPHCESIDGCCVCEGLRCYESDAAEERREELRREVRDAVDSGRIVICGDSTDWSGW